MKTILLMFIGGFLGSGLFTLVIFPNLNKSAYKIGECFSNGLYLEKIVDIEYNQFVMLGKIKDKWLIPDKVSSGSLDRMYTKINCPESMKNDPYVKGKK